MDREDFIVAKALPEEEQPGSDMDDMRDLLETRYRSLEHIFTEQEFRRRFDPGSFNGPK